jgi:hypothetical protein
MDTFDLSEAISKLRKDLAGAKKEGNMILQENGLWWRPSPPHKQPEQHRASS